MNTRLFKLLRTDPFSLRTFWHVTVGKAQVYVIKWMTSDFHLVASVSESWFCASWLTVTHCHGLPGRLNGTKPSLLLSPSKMYAVKKSYCMTSLVIQWLLAWIVGELAGELAWPMLTIAPSTSLCFLSFIHHMLFFHYCGTFNWIKLGGGNKPNQQAI